MNGQKKRKDDDMKRYRSSGPGSDFSRFGNGIAVSAPAKVEKVNGVWRAVRLDGKPRIDDKFGPPTS